MKLSILESFLSGGYVWYTDKRLWRTNNNILAYTNKTCCKTAVLALKVCSFSVVHLCGKDEIFGQKGEAESESFMINKGWLKDDLLKSINLFLMSWLI